jgi:hypothetical protein
LIAVFVLSSEDLVVLSLPSAVAPLSATPSVPSVGISSSVDTSSVFSGSTKIVGGATVAITKSLSEIVAFTFSGSLIDDIFILVPISRPSKSTTSSSGIVSEGHLSSTLLLTMFKTPPLLRPGDFSLFINFTGISIITLAPFTILKKSMCIGLSVIGS